MHAVQMAANTPTVGLTNKTRQTATAAQLRCQSPSMVQLHRKWLLLQEQPEVAVYHRGNAKYGFACSNSTSAVCNWALSAVYTYVLRLL